MKLMRVGLLALWCTAIGQNSWALPVMWYAEGVLQSVGYNPSQPPGGEEFANLRVGTPWSLLFTWETETPGVCFVFRDIPSCSYPAAIVDTVFQLGEFTYFNYGGEIFVNRDLPVYGFSTSTGRPGLVQFHWGTTSTGWTGGLGGPNLNYGAGLLIAGYNDVNSIDGSLPMVVPVRGVQGALNEMQWRSVVSLGSGGTHFWTYGFNPTLVPEPGSLLLVGSGLWYLARRRKRQPN